MPETSDHSIILDKLNASELFKAINTLITNNKLRKKIQNDGFNNVKHLIKENSELIDDIREKLIPKSKGNYNKNKLRNSEEIWVKN